MGAINKLTNKYEYPKIAEKNNKYMCPDCKNDVILKKGNIRIHHFAHYKSDNPCMYYERPGESEIHKDAKMALKTILEKDTNINFMRKCVGCNNTHTHNIEKSNEHTSIHIEYPFTFKESRKKADIACVDGDSIKYIFEICYKNKTSPENRPEPWFEINAEKLLYDINNQDINDNTIYINCIRSENCNNCLVEIQRIKQMIEMEDKRLKQIKEQQLLETKRIEQNKQKHRELYKKMLAEHKRCSKCKSYERCYKCVDKIWKKSIDIIKTSEDNA